MNARRNDWHLIKLFIPLVTLLVTNGQASAGLIVNGLIAEYDMNGNLNDAKGTANQG